MKCFVVAEFLLTSLLYDTKVHGEIPTASPLFHPYAATNAGVVGKNWPHSTSDSL